MRKPILALAAIGLITPLTPIAAAAASGTTAAQTGLFGPVFADARGINCSASLDPAPVCNPTANAIAQLADGRQIYWSGLEGMDDLKGNTVATGYGNFALNSKAALLDMRGAKPRFSTMKNADSGINADGNEAENEYLPGGLYNNDNKNNDGDLFCADLNFLADGRIITNGGTSYYQEPGVPGYPEYGAIELNGLKNTRIFDPRSNRWSEVGKMNRARWYPTMVTQADGSIITFSGVTKMIKPFYPSRPADSFANERHVERFSPKTGKWTELPATAKKSMPLFPRLHLLPDGRTLFNAVGQVANPGGAAIDEATWNFVSVFDPKTNTWTDLGIPDFGGQRLGFRGSGVSVMLTLKPGDSQTRFLSVGGVPLPWPGGHFGTATSTLTTIENRGNGFTSISGGALHSPRWLTDGVLLSTGQVWAVNGGDRDHLHTPGLEFANKTTEMWDPETGKWTVMAPQTRPRSYHTTAMLLPDARVLVGGHAPAGTVYGEPTDVPRDTFGMSPGYADSTFQVFSPPNLFYGKRPVITGVDPSVKTGQILTVKVDRPGEISSIRMMRNVSLTHLVDGDQRNVELEIVKVTKNAVQVKVPGGTYLPPGPYMLFAHTDTTKGEVPSVSRQVFVDAKLPASQVEELKKRQKVLVPAELQAGVPRIPVTQDPSAPALPVEVPGQDGALFPATADRTISRRRAKHGRRAGWRTRTRRNGHFAAHWPDGHVCRTCHDRALCHRGTCPGCGNDAVLAGRVGGAAVCTSCAGFTNSYACSRCGTESKLHGGRLCTRCALHDRLGELLDDGTGQVRPELLPLRSALLSVANPLSGLSWLHTAAPADLLHRLSRGEIELTHEAFHELQPWQAAAHLRELLMGCGLLPQVDKQILLFQRWLSAYLPAIADPARARTIRQFATWQVLPWMHRRAATDGPLGPSTRRHVGSQVKCATEFHHWLDHHGRTPVTCTQADLDRWHVEHLGYQHGPGLPKLTPAARCGTPRGKRKCRVAVGIRQ